MELFLAVLAVGMFFIGYFTRTIVDAIRKQLTIISDKLKSPMSVQGPDEPKSSIVEALTPEQQAKKDLEERVKRINL